MAVKNWKKKQLLEKLAKGHLQGMNTDSLLLAKQFISDLLDFKKLVKLDKTFIQGPMKAAEYNKRDRVFCDFNLDGTVTGRLSCTKCSGEKGADKGVSFHTLAKKDKKLAVNIRSAYVAEKDSLFLAADYSTMELRVLAQIANVQAMKESFIKGEDLHTDTASKIFDIIKSEISKDSFERSAAKLANFLIVYGGQAQNLAESIGIDIKKAQWIINKHSQVYPEIEEAVHDTYMELHEIGYIETIFGRRRRFPDFISPDDKVRRRCVRQAFNTKVQSAASDILLCADEGIRRDFQKFNITKSRTLANVHDSYEASVHKSEVEQVVRIVYNNMKNNPIFRSLGIKFNVPLEVELELGTSFGEGVLVHFDSEGNPLNLNEVIDEILY